MPGPTHRSLLVALLLATSASARAQPPEVARREPDSGVIVETNV